LEFERRTSLHTPKLYIHLGGGACRRTDRKWMPDKHWVYPEAVSLSRALFLGGPKVERRRRGSRSCQRVCEIYFFERNVPWKEAAKCPISSTINSARKATRTEKGSEIPCGTSGKRTVPDATRNRPQTGESCRVLRAGKFMILQNPGVLHRSWEKCVCSTLLHMLPRARVLQTETGIVWGTSVVERRLDPTKSRWEGGISFRVVSLQSVSPSTIYTLTSSSVWLGWETGIRKIRLT
jgi:hypothetical protein